MDNEYRRLLEELNDVLEGGDVSLDFENKPSAATTIRIISDIVGNALRGVTYIDELQRRLDDIYQNIQLDEAQNYEKNRMRSEMGDVL
jgi:hypothetical protein